MGTLAIELRRRAVVAGMVALFSGVTSVGCKTTNNAGQSGVSSASDSDETIAVILTSHGDIDSISELESYIKVSFQKNVGIPLPYWVRPAISDPAYRLSVGEVRSQYEIIGATKYRENSQKQIDALANALKEAGLKAKTYYGFNFTTPFIADTMEQIKKDGIKKVIVFNQGAQCSWASQGENMEDVRDYLTEHPEFDAEVIGYREYSNDTRFRDLLHDVIMRDVKQTFGDASPGLTCVLMASHGLPTKMTNDGDPAIKQMRDAFDYIATKAKPYRFYHGFLNDDFIPGATWAQPEASEAAKRMRSDGCRNILMDSRLSFTVNHRATKFDLDTEARQIFETKDPKQNWQAALTWTKPKVVLAKQFDGDPGFAKLIAELTKEAVAHKGDLEIIKDLGKPVYPKPPVKEWCQSKKL